MLVLVVDAPADAADARRSAAPRRNCSALALGAYFVLAMLLVLAGRRHWPGRRTLVLDACARSMPAPIAMLMYASGGVEQQPRHPAGRSRWARWRCWPSAARALVIAAIAALAILVQQIASQLGRLQRTVSDYPLAGVMGAIVFLVAASAWPVAKRLRESEAQVRRQEVDLANMAQLSQYIVQRLRESILVVDPSDRHPPDQRIGRRDARRRRARCPGRCWARCPRACCTC